MIYVRIVRSKFSVWTYAGLPQCYFGGSVLMPYFSFRSFSCSSFFFVSIFWKACDKKENIFTTLEYIQRWFNKTIVIMKSHTTRRSFYVLCLRCSRGPPGSGCRRWSLTGGRMRSWRQKCLRRPRRRFLSTQGCFLWGPKAENNTVSDFTSMTSLLKTAVGGKKTSCAHKCLRSDLTNGPIFPEDVVHFLCCDFIGKVPDVQDSVDLWR